MTIDREKHPHLSKMDFEKLTTELKSMELKALIDAIIDMPEFKHQQNKLKSIAFKNSVLQELKQLHSVGEKITKLLSDI